MASAAKYEASADAYDVFISHCKRESSSEDKALWVVDVFEEA